jgi:HPt (histidine-containing phosphotransfer) domain-containing protein
MANGIHKFKGPAGTLGAAALLALADDIEEACERGDGERVRVLHGVLVDRNQDLASAILSALAA